VSKYMKQNALIIIFCCCIFFASCLSEEKEDYPVVPEIQGYIIITGLDDYEGNYVIVSGRRGSGFLLGAAEINYEKSKEFHLTPPTILKEGDVVKGVKIIDGSVKIPHYGIGISGEIYTSVNDNAGVNFINVYVYISKQEAIGYTLQEINENRYTEKIYVFSPDNFLASCKITSRNYYDRFIYIERFELIDWVTYKN